MILYGASGHARVIMDMITSAGGSISYLIDDNPELDSLDGCPVVHEKSTVEQDVIISIGNNKVRKMIAERGGYNFGKVVSNKSIVSTSAVIGEGSVVMQGAIVQTCAKVGKHCIINTGSSVDHECMVGDYSHISPHATLCGNVTVGEGTWVGAGTTVIQGVKIGKWSVIGAGSVVVGDIPDGVLAYGNPCRVIRKL